MVILVPMTYYSNDDNSMLAVKYQHGDKQAGLKLLDNFQPLLMKFANLIYYGKYDLTDQHTQEFLKTLISSYDNNKAKNIISLINNMFRAFDYEDIMQELKLIFLELTKRYDPDMATFQTYIKVYWKYELRKHVMQVIHNSPITMPISDFAKCDKNNVWDMFSGLIQNGIKEEFFDYIDDNWVAGYTCSSLFQQLTEEERLILRYRYIEGMTGVEIAEKINKAQPTVYERIRSIKKKLARYRKEKKENIIILDSIRKGKTHQEIGRLIGKHQSTITRRIRKII